MLIPSLRHRAWAIAYLSVVWFLQPIAVWDYYVVTLGREWYPIDGDSIGLPIGLNLVLWILLSPFAIWAIVRMWRRFPDGSVSLFVWRRDRWILSTVLSALLLLPALKCLLELVIAIQESLLRWGLFCAALLLAVLMARALLVSGLARRSQVLG